MPLVRQCTPREQGHVLFVSRSSARDGQSESYCCQARTGWSPGPRKPTLRSPRAPRASISSQTPALCTRWILAWQHLFQLVNRLDSRVTTKASISLVGKQWMFAKTENSCQYPPWLCAIFALGVWFVISTRAAPAYSSTPIFISIISFHCLDLFQKYPECFYPGWSQNSFIWPFKAHWTLVSQKKRKPWNDTFQIINCLLSTECWHW